VCVLSFARCYRRDVGRSQTNFTLTVVMPDVDCAHAVLRVRYISNKPTEPLAFHQCADISIVKSNGTSAATATAHGGTAAATAARDAMNPAPKESAAKAAMESAAKKAAGVGADNVGMAFALMDQDLGTSAPYALLGEVDITVKGLGDQSVDRTHARSLVPPHQHAPHAKHLGQMSFCSR